MTTLRACPSNLQVKVRYLGTSVPQQGISSSSVLLFNGLPGPFRILEAKSKEAWEGTRLGNLAAAYYAVATSKVPKTR